jgi:hypothetical protein
MTDSSKGENMKKTISIAALAVSATTSFAFMAPPTETKTYCLNMYTDASGAMAGSCDQTRNNVRSGVQLGENGCAADQIALSTSRWGDGEFPIQISPCLPPNVAQL